MFEKAKIIGQKFKIENLMKMNYDSESSRITKGKIASVQGAFYKDANKEDINYQKKKRPSSKRK